jgi:hypothetical protein
VLQHPAKNLAFVPRRIDKFFSAPVLSALVSLFGSVTSAEPYQAATLPAVTIQAPTSDLSELSPASQSISLYDEGHLSIAHERSLDEILRGEAGLAIS